VGNDEWSGGWRAFGFGEDYGLALGEVGELLGLDIFGTDVIDEAVGGDAAFGVDDDGDGAALGVVAVEDLAGGVEAEPA
jgi:hypothetical protein